MSQHKYLRYIFPLRNSRETWVGLTNLNEEGRWMFTDGSNNTIIIDMSGVHNENCTRIKANGLLADISCSKKYNYICMIDGKTSVSSCTYNEISWNTFREF